VVIDHQLGNRKPAHRLRQDAEALHVGDVENYQYLGILETLGSQVARISNINAEEELVHLRPGRWVDDLRADSHLAEQPRERRLGTAAVAIRIDVSGHCDRASRAELLRETLDRLPSLLGDA